VDLLFDPIATANPPRELAGLDRLTLGSKKQSRTKQEQGTPKEVINITNKWKATNPTGEVYRAYRFSFARALVTTRGSAAGMATGTRNFE
jgi:hypothetical protein